MQQKNNIILFRNAVSNKLFLTISLSVVALVFKRYDTYYPYFYDYWREQQRVYPFLVKQDL